LRQLADYLAEHPDLPVCIFGWDVNVYPPHHASEAEGRAEVDRIAAILGVPVIDQTAEDGHYIARRSFGLVTYPGTRRPLGHRGHHDDLRARVAGRQALGPGEARGGARMMRLLSPLLSIAGLAPGAQRITAGQSGWSGAGSNRRPSAFQV
jgi:hypothetical protein